MEPVIWRQTLGDLLRRTAARVPQKTAVRCGGRSWTYAEFDRLCDELAAGLLERGVLPGDRVAILARNSDAFVAIRFGLARIGAVLVPVNFMLNAQEAAYILRHSGARLLCVDSELAELGRAAAALDTEVEQLIWLPGEQDTLPPQDLVCFDELRLGTTAVSQVALEGSTPAQIIYTSGTESTPKGALLSHEALLWEYVSCLVDAQITTDDLMLHALPLYHCAQLDCFLGPAVYVGATNIITSRPTPDNLLPLLERHHISSFFAPPTVWISLLRAPLFDKCDLSSLRKAYYGASTMPVEVLREMQRRLPQVRLWNLYGQTEIAPVATILKPEDQLRKPGSAGRPVLNVETRIVDAAGSEVAVGEVGEIVHRSPQLIRGYYRDEARTKLAFAGGWFHSGDLATRDAEGYITIVDRRKDMIKSGGENVSSREVEEAIYQLAQVAEVAVVGLADPTWIEAVTAVVVLKESHSITAAQVISHCASRLSPFKVPKRVLFADALPRNPSGKVLKRVLREKCGDLTNDPK
ncbi:MAG TPA: acyl-CoA synthetase [Steroidobacteraceae bacterium]